MNREDDIVERLDEIEAMLQRMIDLLEVIAKELTNA